MLITSRQNPQALELAKLAASPRADLALAEGWHLTQELLRDAPELARILAIAENFADTANGEFAMNFAREHRLKTLVMTAEVYAKISALKSPEGIAVAFAPREFSLAAVFQHSRLLIAAGVQDPGNAGALARIAEAADFSAMLSAGGVNPASGKFLRAAMGSAFRLPCKKAAATEIIAAARAAPMPLIVAANAETARDYRDFDFPDRYAIVIGGEGAGVPEEFLTAAAATVKIPLSGKVESLNAAVAAGILLFAARDKDVKIHVEKIPRAR